MKKQQTMSFFPAALLLQLVVCCVFFRRASSSASVDDVFSRTLQTAFRNLNAGSEAIEESADDERPYLPRRPWSGPIGRWRDCGGRKTVVRIRGFQMNETCLKTPGRVLIAFNVSADRDVTQPISVDLKVQMRKGKVWADVCGQLPGGCRRDNVCPTADELSSVNEETAEADDYDEGQQLLLRSASSAASVCVAKGFTIGTQGSYDVPKVSPGTYRAVARFKKGSDLEVACIDLSFRVCA